MTRRLTELRPGQSGTLVSIDSHSPKRLDRLSVLGLVPGCLVKLEQRWPTYVVRVGFTQVSIERDVARDILIEVA